MNLRRKLWKKTASSHYQEMEYHKKLASQMDVVHNQMDKEGDELSLETTYYN